MSFFPSTLQYAYCRHLCKRDGISSCSCIDCHIYDRKTVKGIQSIMICTLWIVFAMFIQITSSMETISQVECPEDFHFTYELQIDNSSLIAEYEIWAPKCARMPELQETADDESSKLNASALSGCFNLTVNISTIQGLNDENRYKFEAARSTNPTAENLTTCFPILKSLLNCSQMSWFSLQERFYLTEQLTLEDKISGRNFSLGQYFISTVGKLRDYNLTEFEFEDQANKTIAITCDEELSPPATPYCQLLQFQPEDFQLLPDDIIYFPNMGTKLWFPSYKNNTEDGTIDLCYPLSSSLQNCGNLHPVDRRKMRGKVDKVLYRIYIPSLPYKRIFNLGNYYFDEAMDTVTICLDDTFIPQTIFWCITGLFIVSAICIFLTILLHNCMGLQSTKQNAKPLFNYMLSMMFLFIFCAIRNFSFQVELTVYRYVLFAMCLYFALSSFLWLSVLSFDVWHNFSDLNDRIGRRSCFRCKYCNNSKTLTMILYHIYAWGIPILFVGFALLLDLQVDYQKQTGLYIDIYTNMWLTKVKGISTGLIFFYGPIGVVLVANIIFFVLTVLNLQEISKGTSSANKQISKQMLIVCIKLFVIMGLTWIFEIIEFVIPPKTIPGMAFLVFHLLNASTGILIFLLYVCKRQTLKVLRKVYSKGTSEMEMSKLSSISTNN